MAALQQSMSSWFGAVSKQVSDLMYEEGENKPKPELGQGIEAKEKSAEKISDDAKDDENENSEATVANEKMDGDTSAPASVESAGPKIDLDDLSHKAADAAKLIGSSLFTFANKASRTAAETAKSFRAATDNTILGEFEQEQQKFCDESERKKFASETASAAVPPWIGYKEEALIRKQILSLSLDSRNFLRDPPSGTQFNFDFDQMKSVAIATLEEDPNLRKMRFQLVPKQIVEDRFWRNYFYRVSLIKQSANLSTLDDIAREQMDVPCTSEQQRTGDSDGSSRSGSRQSGSPVSVTVGEAGAVSAGVVGSPGSPGFGAEFLSDAPEPPNISEEELARVREQLGIAHAQQRQQQNKGKQTTKNDPDNDDGGSNGGVASSGDVDDNSVENWEEEILADLNDYELVSKETGKSEQEWEAEISQLLLEEEGGVKEADIKELSD